MEGSYSLPFTENVLYIQFFQVSLVGFISSNAIVLVRAPLVREFHAIEVRWGLLMLLLLLLCLSMVKPQVFPGLGVWQLIELFHNSTLITLTSHITFLNLTLTVEQGRYFIIILFRPDHYIYQILYIFCIVGYAFCKKYILKWISLIFLLFPPILFSL